MLEHISVSQARMFKTCPKQWFFKYVQKLKQPISDRMLLGIAVHKGLAHANTLRQAALDIEHPTDTIMNEIMRVTNDEADGVVVDKDGIPLEVLWDSQKDMEGLKASAKTILSRVVPTLTKYTGMPEYIEHPIPEITLPCGMPLVGYVDLVDADGAIYDFKVGARAKSQGDVDADLQLSLYSYAMHPGTLKTIPVYLMCVSCKNGDVTKVAVKRDQWQSEAAIQEMDETAQLMATGIYPPNTEGWPCSPTYCGYWSICKFGGGRQSGG